MSITCFTIDKNINVMHVSDIYFFSKNLHVKF